jgi:hypothetical protein
VTCEMACCRIRFVTGRAPVSHEERKSVVLVDYRCGTDVSVLSLTTTAAPNLHAY